VKTVYLVYRTWGISLRRSGWSAAAECGLASGSFGDGVLAGGRRSGYTYGVVGNLVVLWRLNWGIDPCCTQLQTQLRYKSVSEEFEGCSWVVLLALL